jgi:hypothetical protein
MNQSPKPTIFKQLLQSKAAAQNADRKLGTLSNSDLLRKFSGNGKPQPIIRRGGRNGSGKP